MMTRRKKKSIKMTNKQVQKLVEKVKDTCASLASDIADDMGDMSYSRTQDLAAALENQFAAGTLCLPCWRIIDRGGE